jgi:cell division transport system ATP-binding protein
MRLLDRINRSGTTIAMATHDHAIVDAMQRRVVQLDDGRIIRDEKAGRYETEQVAGVADGSGGS